MRILPSNEERQRFLGVGSLIGRAAVTPRVEVQVLLGPECNAHWCNWKHTRLWTGRVQVQVLRGQRESSRPIMGNPLWSVGCTPGRGDSYEGL